jgi:hypothetical protein
MSNRYLVRFAASALLAGGLFAAASAAPASATADDGVLKLWSENGESRDVSAREGCVVVDPAYYTAWVDNPTGYVATFYEAGDCTGAFVGIVPPGLEHAYLNRPADVQSVKFIAEGE